MGAIPATGIAGLTRGGGVGWLCGEYGLACDNLPSVDIVAADSRLRTASPDEHPEAIDVLVAFIAQGPSPYTSISLQQMHGAAARVPPSATTFAHRRDQWEVQILSQWLDAADDEPNIRWARDCHAALAPHLEPGVYVNSLGSDEASASAKRMAATTRG